VTRVLVTGAGGFIGLPLLVELSHGDREIHALSRTSRAAMPGVHWHTVDLFDPVAVDRLVAELAPEQLIHLAWCTEHGRYWHAPENVAWVQHSLHLLRAFARCGGRRAVMTGTCAEYDWSAVSGPLVESSSPVAPSTLYGTAKDALRRVACAYAEQSGIQLAWARLFFLYGPRESPARLIPSVIHALTACEPLRTGSGERVRDFMHVEDVAGALVALLDSSVVGAVNVASGVAMTIGELIDVIVQVTGHAELVELGALSDRPGEPALLLGDVARLRDEVGYRPRLALADGLAGTVRWWAQGGSVDIGPKGPES
jgi:nucleoside-diphosphate-sugar epimerase